MQLTAVEVDGDAALNNGEILHVQDDPCNIQMKIQSPTPTLQGSPLYGAPLALSERLWPNWVSCGYMKLQYMNLAETSMHGVRADDAAEKDNEVEETSNSEVTETAGRASPDSDDEPNAKRPKCEPANRNSPTCEKNYDAHRADNLQDPDGN